MKTLTLAFLAVATFGASAGPSAALPLGPVGAPAVATDGLVEDVRVVCDRRGRCWNTRRYARGYYGPRYHGYYGRPRYYAWPAYPYYRPAPAVGIGIGPFGIGIW